MKKLFFTLSLITLFASSAFSQTTSTYAGTGSNGDNAGSGTGQSLSSLTMNYPYGMAMDSKGNIYVSYEGISGDGEIIIILKSDGKAYRRAGSYSNGGFKDAGGVNAQLQLTQSICVGDGDTVYFVDAGNHCVRRMTPFTSLSNTQQIVTICGGGVKASGSLSAISGYKEAAGKDALFNNPSGIAWDPSTKSLIVADKSNQVIRRLVHSATANVWVSKFLAGRPGANPTSKDGKIDSTGSGGLFAAPTAVWVDNNGDVYVLEEQANAIRKVSGGNISTVAKFDFSTFNDIGIETPSSFCKKGSDWYVSVGCKLVKISGTKVSIVSGQPTNQSTFNDSCGNVDGYVTKSVINKAKGILLLDADNLLFADKEGNKIRKLCISTSCMTALEEEENTPASFVIYPNPARDYIMIENNNLSADATISLYDLTGRLILKQDNDFGAGACRINLPENSKGMFIIRVQTGTHVFAKPVLVN